MMARSAVRDDAAREAGGRAPNAGDAALPARKLPTPDALNSTSTSDRIPQPRGWARTPTALQDGKSWFVRDLKDSEGRAGG